MTRNIWHKCRRTTTRSRSTFARFAKKHERRLYGWAVIVWLVPGSIVSWYLRDSVPWVTGISWYAIVVSHATMWTAKRAEEATNV